MGFSEIATQHCTHHIAPGNQHCSMRLDLSIVQFEDDITEHTPIDALLQILLDKLKWKWNNSVNIIGLLRPSAMAYRCVVANVIIIILSRRLLHGRGYRFTQIRNFQEVGGLLNFLDENKRNEKTKIDFSAFRSPIWGIFRWKSRVIVCCIVSDCICARVNWTRVRINVFSITSKYPMEVVCGEFMEKSFKLFTIRIKTNVKHIEVDHDYDQK